MLKLFLIVFLSFTIIHSKTTNAISHYKRSFNNVNKIIRRDRLHIMKDNKYIGWSRDVYYDYFPSVSYIKQAFKPQKCLASYYTDKDFGGRKTANGEIFKSRKLYTAAHPYLPLPSIVRVTNLETGKHLLVRLNDRGPFIHHDYVNKNKNYHRCIDLSEKTAKYLDPLFKKRGLLKVKVEYLSLETELFKSLLGLTN